MKIVVWHQGSGCAHGLDRVGGLHLAGTEPVREVQTGHSIAAKLKASDSGTELGVYFSVEAELL